MRAMEKGSNFFEWTHRTKGGKDFPATVLLTRMTTSGKTFLQATVRDITEQKRSEGALRASERNYKSLVDTATVGVFKTTLDGRILLANKALAGILGFASPEEVTRHKALDFYARKEDRVRFVRLLKAKGRVTDFEVELVRRDKSAARVWLSALVEGGAITGTVVDITERKEAEKQLKNYQLIVESAHDAIFLKDLKSRYVMANDNAARAFGFKRSQVIGKNDLELMKDKKEARKNIDDDQRVFKTRKPVECIKEMTDTKGGKRWFQAIKVPLFDEKGGVSGLVGIARDITKQKSAEQALRESEAGFSEFLNNVPDPVVVVDAVGTILYASKAMEELVGVKAKDFVGKSLVQAPTFDAATKAVMLKNVALRVTGAKIAPYLVYARDSEGRSLPVEVNARAVDLKGRRVVVVVFRDMSARFDLQHKLEASNKALREKTAEMANTIKEFAEANRGLTKSEEKVKQLEEQLRKKP
jgi:PAS domain S-box-containing protein